MKSSFLKLVHNKLFGSKKDDPKLDRKGDSDRFSAPASDQFGPIPQLESEQFGMISDRKDPSPKAAQIAKPLPKSNASADQRKADYPKRPSEIRIRIGRNSTNEVALADRLDYYLPRLGYSRYSRDLLSFVINLMIKGKVRVDFGDYCEHLELVNPGDKLTSAQAMTLLDDFVAERERSEEEDHSREDHQRKKQAQLIEGSLVNARPAGESILSRLRKISSVSATAENWMPGQKLLDDFMIECTLGEGGMGKVYQVLSLSSDVTFAVKRNKGLSEAARRNFLAELQTWIDLPDHPNIVACRFFRTMGEEVLIFSEYVDGGSLRDWIDQKALYEAPYVRTPQEVLARMLDIAIQFAWGIHCAHEAGIIHQDIKPANVMMTLDGTAKVADFGLAGAQRTAGETAAGDPKQTILASYSGMTPAYCSPEQATAAAQYRAGAAYEMLPKLTRRTDLWSWGVSVFEMFTGEVTWHSGAVAAEALELHLKTQEKEGPIPAMPSEVAEVLRGCFRKDPARRWESLGKIVDLMKAAYRKVMGAEYPRVLTLLERRAAPQAGVAERTLQGAQWNDPQVWLERALKAAGRDPSEAAEIVTNHGRSRRGQLVTDLAVYDEARRMLERLVTEGGKDLESILARLCNAAAPVQQAADDFPGALGLSNKAIQILEQLVNIGGQRELANDLAIAYMNKANALRGLGDRQEAFALYDRAIEIFERLVIGEGRRELAQHLAIAYMNKANALHGLDDHQAAVTLDDRAIKTFERLVISEGRRELVHDLAIVYMNKANALRDFGDELEAVIFYDQAIGIWERLVNIGGRRELAGDLARAKAFHGVCLIFLDKKDRGQKEAREAMVALSAEIKRTGRSDLKAALDWVAKQIGEKGVEN